MYSIKTVGKSMIIDKFKKKERREEWEGVREGRREGGSEEVKEKIKNYPDDSCRT